MRKRRAAGMNAIFQVDLASSVGKTRTSGSDRNEVVFDAFKADGQKFLFSGLEAIRDASPDNQGVLGQWFLSQFDYTLDLYGKRIEFGKQDRSGTRTPFKMMNARPVISTSFGALALQGYIVFEDSDLATREHRLVLSSIGAVGGAKRNQHQHRRRSHGDGQRGADHLPVMKPVVVE